MDGLAQVLLFWLFSDQALGFLVGLLFGGSMDWLHHLGLLSFWRNHQSFSVDVRLSGMKHLGFFLHIQGLTRNGFIMVDLRHSFNLKELCPSGSLECEYQ